MPDPAPPRDASDPAAPARDASAVPAAPPRVEPIDRLRETREVFWQNVVREMLMTFPSLVAQTPDIGDGRVGLLTRHGERIPLADARPLFPCSITSPEGMALCLAVQATVFSVRTPSGEVFTVPVDEIRAVHTVTDELIEALEAQSRRLHGDGADGTTEPFGFAAFTSLNRSRGNPLDQPGI